MALLFTHAVFGLKLKSVSLFSIVTYPWIIIGSQQLVISFQCISVSSSDVPEKSDVDLDELMKTYAHSLQREINVTDTVCFFFYRIHHRGLKEGLFCDKSGIIFLHTKHVVGTHYKRLDNTLLMSTL